jgi:probable F420-dependent oxidoreductase
VLKVRIGISLGAGEPAEFGAAVDLLEAAGVDSLWLPELTYSPAIEPFTGMAFAVARTRRLKAGSGISVLPGRHPVLVAKQLASLAGLAPGRVLPVFGLQPALAAERPLFPVPEGQRAAVFDEALTLLRLLLTSPSVTFSGTFFTVTDASVGALPAKPLDIWLGGSAPAGLRRIGRLADGWLGSLLTPQEAGAAVRVIQEAAAGAGREVDPDHFGLSLPVAFGGVPAALAASIARRRPGVAPESLVADGWAGARELIARYVEAGLSKFVMRQASGTEPLASFVDGFTTELMPLQTLVSGRACGGSGSAGRGTGCRRPRTRVRRAARRRPRRTRRAVPRNRARRARSGRRSRGRCR